VGLETRQLPRLSEPFTRLYILYQGLYIEDKNIFKIFGHMDFEIGVEEHYVKAL
jgi:hypothetical protein